MISETSPIERTEVAFRLLYTLISENAIAIDITALRGRPDRPKSAQAVSGLKIYLVPV